MRLKITDWKTVKDFMFHPAVFDITSDDHSIRLLSNKSIAEKDELCRTLLRTNYIHFLHPKEGVLFMLTMRTITLWEVHTMILPEYRGSEAVKATLDAAAFHFNNTRCEKVVTYIPTFNKAAKIFAKKAKMRDEGVCTKSFLKDGILHDQWVLGLEKETICQL